MQGRDVLVVGCDGVFSEQVVSQVPPFWGGTARCKLQAML